MVDIAFLLLIFFLVATTIMPEERDLTLMMPRPGVDTEAPSLPLWIEIENDQSVWWGAGDSRMEVGMPDEGRDLPRLQEMVDAAVAGGGASGSSVVLKVGDDTRQQRFTDVLNVLYGAGLEKIGMVD